MTYFTKLGARDAAKQVIHNGWVLDSVTVFMKSESYQASF